jgi:hypothetical protein
VRHPAILLQSSRNQLGRKVNRGVQRPMLLGWRTVIKNFLQTGGRKLAETGIQAATGIMPPSRRDIRHRLLDYINSIMPVAPARRY